MANVSTSTVSHVINGTRFVSPELAARVRAAMEELSYRPNQIARSLRTKRSRTISLVISDITNPFFSVVVRGAEDAAVQEGYSIAIWNTDEDSEKEERCIASVQESRSDGVIFVPTGYHKKPLLQLQKEGIPVVLLDRKVPGVKADVVLSNNVEAAFQATSYLIENGHSRIAIILGRKGVTSSDERFKGFKKAMRKAGIPMEREYIVRGDYRVEGGRQACQTLLELDPPPTAIFVVNNRMTVGALEALQEAQYSCPEDVSLIGFDDFEGLSLFDPPVTTVAQQPYQLGYEAVKTLLTRIHGENPAGFTEHRLECTLVIRGTVGCFSKKEVVKMRDGGLSQESQN